MQSVRGGELAQTMTEQPTPWCPAPYLPCRTSDHQEAGGVLERVESRRQGAVGTEPGLQEKSAGKDPQGRVLGSGSPWQKWFPKGPKDPDATRSSPSSLACARDPEKGDRDRRAKGEELTDWTIQMGTCPPAVWHQVCLE